ncbi:hypothetical protein, partial [Sulfitobacter sp. HI0021]
MTTLSRSRPVTAGHHRCAPAPAMQRPTRWRQEAMRKGLRQVRGGSTAQGARRAARFSGFRTVSLFSASGGPMLTLLEF